MGVYFLLWVIIQRRLPWWLSVIDSACNAGDTGDVNMIPGSGRSPWRRAWQPTPVFVPGESHGQAVHRVTKSRTQLKQFTMHTHMHNPM